MTALTYFFSLLLVLLVALLAVRGGRWRTTGKGAWYTATIGLCLVSLVLLILAIVQLVAPEKH